MSDHSHYEALLMKAVDDVITLDERAELEEHMSGCADCAAELKDFQRIKETTDAMTRRILDHAEIAPPRERGRAEAIVTTSFLLLLIGGVLLLGFAAWTFMTDCTVPAIVKIAGGLAGLGSLIMFGYVLHLRTRSRDPYQEIDR